jgi:hypothetical protein
MHLDSSLLALKKLAADSGGEPLLLLDCCRQCLTDLRVSGDDKSRLFQLLRVIEDDNDAMPTKTSLGKWDKTVIVRLEEELCVYFETIRQALVESIQERLEELHK